MNRRALSIFPGLVVGLSLMALTLSVQAQGDPQAEQATRIEQARQVLTLSDPDPTPVTRRQAAEQLLNDLPASQNAIVTILSGVGPDESGLALCEAIIQYPRPLPPAVGWALIEHLDQRDAALVSAMAKALGRFNDGRVIADLRNIATDRQRPLRLREAAAEALGWQHSKQAASILIELTDPKRAQPLQEKAYLALGRLTGRDDLGMDRRSWLSWWQQTQSLPNEQWRGELINNFVRRDETRRRELNYAVARLVQTQQALYRAAEAEPKVAMIGRMLDDELQAIRMLGIDLAVERLLDNQPIPDSLLAKLRMSLEDPSQAVRGKAALLLRDLNDAESATRIARQLAQQEVTRLETLRAYLRVVAKLPRQMAVEPTLDLVRQPEIRADAAAALAAFADRDLLEEPQKRAALYRIRQLSIPKPSDPELVLLLAKVGQEEDWQRIESWLGDSDATLRQAAAEAWADSNRSLMKLASHAKDDVILPIFLEAARQRGRDRATFEALWPLKPEAGTPNAAAWQRAIIAVAQHVPTDRLIEASQQLRYNEEALTLAEQLLSARLTANPNGDTPALERVDLLLARARLRLISGEPTQTLADLDEAVRAMPKPGDNVLLRDRHARLNRIDQTRIEALLLAGNVDAAVKVAEKPLAPRPIASDGSKPNAVPADDQTLELFIAAAKQRIDAQQPKPATTILNAIEQLAGSEPKPAIAEQIQQMKADIAAMTPATNGQSNGQNKGSTNGSSHRQSPDSGHAQTNEPTHDDTAN